jgi:hypothetical protein
MPSPINLYNEFKKDVMHGVHNFDTDTIKVFLSNNGTNVTDLAKLSRGDITEIAASGGYVAGGYALVKVSSSQTNGTYSYVVQDLDITASGGSIGPFRYVVFYNSSKLRDTNVSTSNPLIGYADYGSSITLNDGETLRLDFDQTNGMLRVT